MRIPSTAGDEWSEQKRDNCSGCVVCSESFAMSQYVLVFTDASELVEVSSLNTSVGKVDLLEQVERGFIVKLAGAEFDLWDCPRRTAVLATCVGARVREVVHAPASRVRDSST